MPTKMGQQRPRGDIGLTSAVDTRRTITKSAKPARNRNRVTSAKPPAPARQPPRR